MAILPKLSATILWVYSSVVVERIATKAAIASGFPMAILPKLSATDKRVSLSLVVERIGLFLT